MHQISHAPFPVDPRPLSPAGAEPRRIELVPNQLEPSHLRLATLFADPALDDLTATVQQFMLGIGTSLDWRQVPAELAGTGTVGRIGVPGLAARIAAMQQTVIAASFGADPLTPVPRLWRGLQRRGHVVVDVRRASTLPGSAAAQGGVTRDVLLVTQRVNERAASRGEAPGADHWARAREAADAVYRLAVAEQREVMLVLPVGRGTGAQRQFGDAVERQSRLQRQAPPRVVKAGLLAALLSGERGGTRWLVASVMPMEQLSQLVHEAIGDTGPWPVVSLGRGTTFYDLPAAEAMRGDPVPLLLALIDMLQRNGRVPCARALFEAVRVTRAAEVRMREELGTPFVVPASSFLAGVLANWGRTPADAAPPTPRPTLATVASDVLALRLRLETSLGAAALREALGPAVLSSGLEVASVRSVDDHVTFGRAQFDVVVRTALGEPPLRADASDALASALGPDMRIVSAEPWAYGAGERSRGRGAVSA